jgi:hypothetical protein
MQFVVYITQGRSEAMIVGKGGGGGGGGWGRDVII